MNATAKFYTAFFVVTALVIAIAFYAGYRTGFAAHAARAARTVSRRREFGVKLGLFGGTFDPVHNAHLFVAEAARVELQLERMIFLPTRGAHYRDAPIASIDDRLAMLRGALAPNPHFAIDTTDLDADASGYSADLMPRLREKYGGAELTFVVGGDSLVDSPWQRFDVVLASLNGFAIAPRAEQAPERVDALLEGLAPGERAKFTFLDLPALNGSATLVRQQLARGGSIRYLVPEFVSTYIAERRLYVGTP